MTTGHRDSKSYSGPAGDNVDPDDIPLRDVHTVSAVCSFVGKLRMPTTDLRIGQDVVSQARYSEHGPLYAAYSPRTRTWGNTYIDQTKAKAFPLADSND